MSDNKKAPAKKPAAKKVEGKATTTKAAAVAPVPIAKPARAKAPVKLKAPPKKPGRKRIHPVDPMAGTKLPPQTRKVKPVKPELSPPTEEVIAEALEELTPKEIQFVETYLTCYNAVKSYLAVYDSSSYGAASSSSSQLLDQPRVRNYMGKRLKAAFERTEEAADRLIQTFQAVAYGDVNELVEHRRDACRFCHGAGHKYQFTPREYEDALSNYNAKVLEAKKEGIELEPFDPLGGIGFNPRKQPHEDCPECFGDGVANVFFKDTRYLSPAAVALYAGAKITQGGIEIKTASQDKARETLAKIQKLYEEKTEVNIAMPSADYLDSIYEAAMAESRERSDAVIGRGARIKDGKN